MVSRRSSGLVVARVVTEDLGYRGECGSSQDEDQEGHLGHFS
jgi:hypothetical protein